MFRASQDVDPLQGTYDKGSVSATEKFWRERHRVSDASGKGGQIELAHIVSRGADCRFKDEPWNWLALTPQEHRGIQHQKGWDELLRIFPHLSGRVEHARNLAREMNNEES